MIINQIDFNGKPAYTTRVKQHEYLVINYGDHWEVYVRNVMTKAYNRGAGGWSMTKMFKTLSDVATKYKNLKGIDILIQTTTSTGNA